MVPPSWSIPFCSGRMATTKVPLPNSSLAASSIPRTPRAYSITASWNPKQSPRNGTRFSRAWVMARIFPSNPPAPEAPGDHDPVHLLKIGRGIMLGIDPPDLDLCREGPSRVFQGFLDADIDILNPVLADETDGDPAGILLHDRAVPRGIRLSPVEAEVIGEDVGKPLPLELQGHLVDIRHCGRRDHPPLLYVAEGRDLLLRRLAHAAHASRDDDIRREAELPQGLHRVLGRLGLHVPHGIDGDQGHVDEGHVLGRQLPPHLPDRLEERHTLDIPDCSPDLHHADICHPVVDGLSRSTPDRGLDLVGDMGDDLDRGPEEVSLALPVDDRPVHLPRGDVVIRRELDVEEPLVVPEVKVHLTPVGKDIDLAVLGGVHGSRIDVQVRIDLHRRDRVAPALQDPPDGRGRDPLPEAAHHPPCHHDVLHGAFHRWRKGWCETYYSYSMAPFTGEFL